MSDVIVFSGGDEGFRVGEGVVNTVETSWSDKLAALVSEAVVILLDSGSGAVVVDTIVSL
jgi:hypothetical protein